MLRLQHAAACDFTAGVVQQYAAGNGQPFDHQFLLLSTMASWKVAGQHTFQSIMLRMDARLQVASLHNSKINTNITPGDDSVNTVNMYLSGAARSECFQGMQMPT
jgi:hypothetical protein